MAILCATVSGCAADLNELRAASEHQVATISASTQQAVSCLTATAEEKLNAVVNTTFDAELGVNEIVADVAADESAKRAKFKVLYAVWPRDGKNSNVRYSVRSSAKDSEAMLDAARSIILACNGKLAQRSPESSNGSARDRQVDFVVATALARRVL